MTDSDNNSLSDRIDFLANIANEVDTALTNNPQLKSLMIKHIGKVIQEAERYRLYLLEQWQKAKEAGWLFCDKDKNSNEWTWILDAYSGICKDVYFTENERRLKKGTLSVQFYIEGKPKPNPLDYLESMIWGSVGQIHSGLELLDYQFVLLAIIHDAQNWQAGRESIYFNRLKENSLSDRLCKAVWCHLESYLDSYQFRDVKQTIKKALQVIIVDIGQADRKSGDTYFANQMSFGDKAQHAGRDINQTTTEPKKNWKKWIISSIVVLASLATILIFLFGDNFCERIRKKPKRNAPIIEQTMTNSPNGLQVAGDLHINQAENPLNKPIVTAEAFVEVRIKSDLDFNGLVANMKAYLVFGKGDKSLLKASSLGYRASQTGKGEVVYKANLNMDASDSAVGNPVSFLRDTEYIQILFGRLPPDSNVLGGNIVCTINNSVRLESAIPPQKLVDAQIFILDLSTFLQAFNEPSM